MVQAPLAGVTFPMLSPHPSGDYAIAYHDTANRGIVGVLGGNLALGTTTQVPTATCRYLRAEALPTGLVGVSCICTNSCTLATLYDPTTQAFTPLRRLAPTAIAPTRSAANADGLWTAYPATVNSVAVRLVRADGTLAPVQTLGAMPPISQAFGYDVAARADGRAYAVWIDDATTPALRVMQLCP